MALGSSIGAALTGGSLGTLTLRLVAETEQFSSSMDKALGIAQTTTTGITSAFVKMGTAVAATLTGIGALSVSEFAKFEASFANVRKTVDGTEKELGDLSNTMRKMALDMPFNVNKMNEVAAAAGQLGIKKQNIAEFTKVMMEMGITTNLAAEQAAEEFAKFATITQMPQEAFRQLGNAVSLLDKTSVSTAKDIMDMGLRMAGPAMQAGFTRTEVLGLASALANIGVHAELGSTAATQMIVRMSRAVHDGGDELKAFAAAAHMSGDEFTKTFATDAATAFMKVVQGMAKSTEAGENVFKMFKDLGTEGNRITQTIVGLAQSGDNLAESFKKAKEGFFSDTLTDMARKRYETFNAQIQLTANLLRELGIRIGGELAPFVLQMNKLLQAGLKAWTDWGTQISDVMMNWVTPAIITAVGLIGDAFTLVSDMWNILKVSLYTFLETFTTSWSTVLNTLGRVITTELNIIIAGINLAIEGINKLLPKAHELAEINFKFKVDTTALDNMSKAFGKSSQEAFGKLYENTVGPTFSERLLKEYDKLEQGVKKHNAAIVEDTKGMVKDAATNQVTYAQLQVQQAQAALDKMQEPGYLMGRNKQKRYTGLLGPGLSEFEDKSVVQGMQIANARKEAEDRLKILQDMDAKELKLDADHQAKKIAMQKATNEQIKQLNLALAEYVTSNASKMFGDMADITAVWAGKQNATYMAMFAASKAFAIAEATIKIEQGIASAVDAGWPGMIGAMASVMAATSTIVSTIEQTTLQLTGKKAVGGPVSTGNAYLVGERGPEVFVPASQGNIVPNDMIKGGTRVIVNNYTDTRPEVTESMQNGERVYEILIRRAKSELASEVRDGRGDFNKSVQNAFNLRRGK